MLQRKKEKMSGIMCIECLSCKKHLYTTKRGGMSPCKRWYTTEGNESTNGPGTCKDCYVDIVTAREWALQGLRRENEELKAKMGCYVKARDRAVQLEREIEELKANVDFLRLSYPLFSDVTLVASDHSPDAPVPVPIPANKVVLASHSPVFKAMLETEMKENISGTIKIGDVTCDLLHVFVNYLYTADVCLDEKIASGLLVFAEKYQIKHLKEHCERYLVSNLNWDNSVSNYVLAYQHSAEKLLEACLSIITNNMDKFLNTDEYGELVKKDLSIVVGILEAYAKKQVNTAGKNGSS
ncbi:hypothetical protein Dimus_024207 [Dionaea muscipula]